MPFRGGMPIAWTAVAALVLLVPAQRAQVGGLVERIFLLLVLLWLVLAAGVASRGPGRVP